MPSQQTLRQPVSFAGLGLHSGTRVQMNLLPAVANSGLRFRRSDLDGHPEIEARAEFVVDTQRSTTLGRGSIKIHTVEHILAALAGAGVHNAIVELDANEPPIADGSSRDFARLISEAGVVSQADALEPYRLTEPIELTIGDSHIAAFPSDCFKLTCTSADQKGRFTQHYSMVLTPDSWEKELSHARTFCFFEEIEYLIKNGLIKGGSLDNAIVIREDAVLTNEPLRYAEEFVRHKMLDIVGDLALIGRPILAHVIATKPSHQANTEFARMIVAQIKKPALAAQTFAPPPVPSASIAPTETGTKATSSASRSESSPHPADSAESEFDSLDIMQVMKVLPHRPPFLMVDRITRIHGNKITGVKCITMGEPFFMGHFPGHPVMPGVLQLEAIAQVAGVLLIRQAKESNKIAYFMAAEKVKWRKPVLPGDVLIIEVEMYKVRGKIGKARGVCRVNDEVVSEADVTFMLTEP